MKTPWFRLYTSVLDLEDKTRDLTDKQFRQWIWVLSAYKRNDCVMPETRALARCLGVTENKVTSSMDALVSFGLLVIDGNTWHPYKWDERQYESDVSTERVRTFRKRKLQQQGNVSETPSDARVRTESETETETESESESERAPSRPAAAVPTPLDARPRIAKLADGAPNQQDHRQGIEACLQAVISSLDPEHTLATMERTLPGWWDAMRDGRARSKPLRYVIQDGDWMREAPAERVAKAPPARPNKMDEVRAILAKGRTANDLR